MFLQREMVKLIHLETRFSAIDNGPRGRGGGVSVDADRSDVSP